MVGQNIDRIRNCMGTLSSKILVVSKEGFPANEQDRGGFSYMNQYERIVSYIYQYVQGEKGANAGYAKIEKRGSQVRISVQVRTSALKIVPKVYLYQQFSEGIQTVYMGTMAVRGNTGVWKGSCEADKLFGTNQKLDDMDGIFIEGGDFVYFATSWKKDFFYLGNWNKNVTMEEKQENIEPVKIRENPTKAPEEPEKPAQKDNLPAEQEENGGEGKEEEIEPAEEEKEAEQIEEVSSKVDVRTEEIQPDAKEEMENDIQMQSICGACPFKRRIYDYGKRILMSFPSMKPFESGVAKACVRMELQDIGCLPIASWSLSGNRFLLHGYYCYRHLLFAQLSDGRYVLGVPGIFSEKERRNAYKFGFQEFQSIGDFGMQQGAFGYWFMELPCGNI